MIISFAWTTPALLAHRKSVTRRQWVDFHAKRFKKGDHADAYDRLPRVGGKPVAIVQIREDPYEEPIMAMPWSDYEEEGFAYMHEHQDLIPESSRFRTCSKEEFKEWMLSGGDYWVVRFDLVEVIA